MHIRELICRQLAVKGPESKSWAALVRKLLNRYKLPMPSALIDDPPCKEEWKKTVKNAVHDHWTNGNALRDEARGMSSLVYLNIEACDTRSIHPVWQNLMSPMAIRKATIKALLLIQRYPIATCHVAGPKRRDVCPLCHKEPETLIHFILQCETLRKTRIGYLKHVLNTCRNNRISIDPETLVKIILDSTHHPHLDKNHEKHCRNMLYKLHDDRAMILGGDSSYKF